MVAQSRQHLSPAYISVPFLHGEYYSHRLTEHSCSWELESANSAHKFDAGQIWKSHLALDWAVFKLGGSSKPL